MTAPIGSNYEKGIIVLNTVGSSALAVSGISLSGVGAMTVAIVDGTGTQVTSFGGGTQYTNGGTPPANPIGNAIEWSDGVNWQTVSTAKPLPVTLASTAITGTVAVTQSTSPWVVSNGGTFATQATLAAETTKVIGTVNVSAGQTIGVTGTFWQTTQPISASSLPLPTGAATAVKQPALGIAGTASADVITIQGIAGMTKLLVTPDSVALPANQSVNISQINGVTPLMGNGVTGTGSQRVTIASDNTAFAVNATLSAETTKVIGTINIASSQTLATVTTVSTVTNLAQMNGAALLMGNGVTGTGSQRVTVSSDNTAVANWGQGATGSAVPSGAQYNAGLAQTALPTAATAGNLTGQLSDKFGRQVVLPVTIRDLIGTQTTTISASTSETTIITAAASVFNDLMLLVVSNTSATATRVDFRDTTAGSILFSIYVPAGDVRGFSMGGVAVPQTSVNTNWTAQSSASITDLRIYAVWAKNK